MLKLAADENLNNDISAGCAGWFLRSTSFACRTSVSPALMTLGSSTRPRTSVECW